MRRIAAVLLVLGICVTAGQSAANRIVTATERNTNARLAVGDTLVVRLQSTPSTGYGWQIAACNKKVLKQMGEPVLEDSGKNLPGAPQHQVFKFKALATGNTVLELHYVRPWEKGKPPATIYKLSVTITKPAKPRKK